MKCINKWICLSLLIAVSCVSGCGKTSAAIEQPYDVYATAAYFGLSSNGTAEAKSYFASDLCVSEDVAIGTDSTDSQVAEGAGTFNLETNTVVYAKNLYERLYPASTTKILTAYIALKYCDDLDAMVTVSENAVNQASDSSVCNLKAGDVIRLRDLLYGLMLRSGNDAAVAIAEYISGDVDSFAALMNQEAAAMGATRSHFVNPNGLPDENHYTTASDMARIAKSAWLNPLYRKFCTRRYYEIPATNKFAEARQLLNHHKMIKNGEYYYEGVLGGKTGYTDASGNTLVTYCKRGNITLVAVILNSTSAANAYSDTASLFNYGFENFEKVDMKVSMNPVPFKVLPCDKYILKDNGNTYPFYYKTKVYVTLPKGIKKSKLNKRQAVLSNAVGPLRLKSKYYYNKHLVGWGMQYERNVVSDLLLQTSS